MTEKTSKVILLPEYIAQVGEEKFSQEYGITRRAVQSYRFRTRRPRRETAARIVQDKRNPLTWDSILGYELHKPETRTAPKKRRRRA